MKDALEKFERLTGLSGRRLAAKAGIPPTTYQNYKNRDVTAIPLYNAEKLADALSEFKVPRQDVLALSGYPLGRPLTETEMKAIRLLESIDPEMQDRVIQAMQVFAPEPAPAESKERQVS